jgi:hypothetical protein
MEGNRKRRTGLVLALAALLPGACAMEEPEPPPPPPRTEAQAPARPVRPRPAAQPVRPAEALPTTNGAAPAAQAAAEPPPEARPGAAAEPQPTLTVAAVPVAATEPPSPAEPPRPAEPRLRVVADGTVGCVSASALRLLRGAGGEQASLRLLAQVRAEGGCVTAFRVNEWVLAGSDGDLVRLRLVSGGSPGLVLYFLRSDARPVE